MLRGESRGRRWGRGAFNLSAFREVIGVMRWVDRGGTDRRMAGVIVMADDVGFA